MLTRLAIGAFWLLHFLPLAVLARIGAVAGLAFMAFGRERRKVARTNLALCFPGWDRARREAVLRAHFRAIGRSFFEAGIVWWSSEERIRRIVRIEGQEHARTQGNRRIILLVPHFVGIEMEGLRMSMDCKGMAVYSRQKNRVFDEFLVRVRSRFPGTRMVARQEGVKTLLRGFKDGLLLQLSPDLDLGPRDAIFVPFFGVQAATVTALSRLARLGNAVIVPVVVRQLPGGEGYVLRMYPAWENFPGESVEADTRRMNAFIEERVLEMPEQYYWVHKRFKTRPEGEPRIY
ncbi:MAG TPA: lipid A biosynthesis acyltransferase [Burkholderiales bacterium]|jgi:KDO2-lipid IV(A) lauroyltransferase|nr:lipid A biosynthesis acyltransferase [Burkholderiales bacterium]